MTMDLTASLEDYLEAIYSLCQKENHAHVTDIASNLSLSKPSVHRAIAQLRDAGMVLQEPYGQVTLTEEGRMRAQGIARRHILVKRFLRDVLGLDEETADAEACQVEHAISRETADRLADYLASVVGGDPLEDWLAKKVEE